jgi:hypothetical protein
MMLEKYVLKIKDENNLDEKVEYNSSTFLLINDKHIKIIKNKSDIHNGLLKEYKIHELLSDKPIYIMKIEDKIYIFCSKKIKEIKKYLYKKSMEIEIFISDMISIKSINKMTHFIFNKGLNITSLELLNIKDIKSIEDFYILKINKKSNIKLINNDKIEINSEKDFILHKKEIMNNFRNLSSNLKNNNINNNKVKNLINSLESINKKEKINYFEFKYEMLIKNKNNIIINFNTHQLLLNKNNINKIETETESINFFYENPFGENYSYNLNLYLININKREEKEINIYCFKNDYLKNDPFEINENNIIKQI